MKMKLLVVVLLSLIGYGCARDERGTDARDTAAKAKTSTSSDSSARGKVDMSKLLPRPNPLLADETVSKFLMALKTSDLEQLCSVTDVPFLLEGRVIEASEDLRKQLANLLQDSDALSQLTYGLADTIEFDTIKQKGLSGEVGEFLERQLETRDQMVIADIQLPGKQPDRYVFHVRIREGKARVVAMLDAPAPSPENREKP